MTMAELNSVVEKTIETIRKRSQKSRANYQKRVAMMEADPDSNRGMIGCSNLAHAAAGATDDQADLIEGQKPHVGIITAYNDMLSAHQPYENFLRYLERLFDRLVGRRRLRRVFRQCATA